MPGNKELDPSAACSPKAYGLLGEIPPMSEKTISAASYDSEERTPIYRDTTGRPAVFEPVPAFEPMALMEFSPNQEWEYRVLDCGPNAEAFDLEEEFNKLGAHKWELVAWDPMRMRAAFKRVVEKQS